MADERWRLIGERQLFRAAAATALLRGRVGANSGAHRGLLGAYMYESLGASCS